MRKDSVAERTLMLFNDSLERCRQSGDLAGRFYERLMADPTIQGLFSKTNFDRQKRILTSSLYLVMSAAGGSDDGTKHLDHLAELHARLGIPDEMYDFWLVSMLEAVASLDPRFSAEVEQAWRDVLLPGIEVLRRQAHVDNPSETP